MPNQPQPLMRLTRAAYNALEGYSQSNPEVWLDPSTDFAVVLDRLGITDYAEPTGLNSRRPINLKPAQSSPPNRADQQALDFYENLEGLTPVMASDDLIWAWITHFRIHHYVMQRWPLRNSSNVRDHIRNKWFITNQGSALWRDNAASRTWWIAHCSLKAEQGSSKTCSRHEALRHFAQNAEHYHTLMTYSFTRNETILGEIVYALVNDAAGINNRGLYQLVRRLNRAAGSRYLGVGPRNALKDAILDEVDDLMTDPEFVADRNKLRNRRILKVLSLGAGVQSSALALMADQGLYDLPKPDLAIFADTGWEPPEVYQHLEWLKKQLSYEVVTVSAGDIRQDILHGTNPEGQRFLDVPVFLINPDGSYGIAARQCTAHYKLKPIHQYLRQLLELKPGRRAPKTLQVEMMLGISIDEAARQKPSREEWITNTFPLIDQGVTRAQLYDWFRNNYPERLLPRSACIGCPYKSDNEWKQMKDSDPESFADAVFIDKALRETTATRDAIKGTAFLHKSRQPLASVDLDETESYVNLLLDECEGLCSI